MTPKPRWTNENSSQQAAALVYSVILLPIAQGVHAHRTKPTELLNLTLWGPAVSSVGIRDCPAICD